MAGPLAFYDWSRGAIDPNKTALDPRMDFEAQRRFEAALRDANAATGQPTQINDDFRTYDDQAQAYANYMLYSTGAKSWTDPNTGRTFVAQHPTTLAARPGGGTHEQGMAIDVQPGKNLTWIKANAANYGIEGLPGQAGVVDPVHLQVSQSGTIPRGVYPDIHPNLRPSPQEIAAATAPQSYDYDPLASGTYPRTFPQPPATDPYDYDPLASGTYPITPPPPLVAQNTAPFVDDLGGGMSPLRPYTVAEASDIMAGPYGVDALVRAGTAGDVDGFNKAMADMTGAAMKDAIFGGKGMDGVTAKLQAYFDQLQQQSPGAVRAMQAAYNSNPALQKAIPAQLMPSVQSAFNSLPPLATGQIPMPNLRPSTVPPIPPPLVAQNQPSLAPQMASYEQPSGGGSQDADWGGSPASIGNAPPVQTAGPTTAAMYGYGAPLPSSAFTPPAPPAPYQVPNLATNPTWQTAGAPQWGAGTAQMAMLPSGLSPMNSSPYALYRPNATYNPPSVPMPNMRPPMPQTVTQAMAPQQQPAPMPTTPLGGQVDVSQWAPQQAAAAFAAAHPDNPNYERPTDEQGNFQPNAAWQDPTAFLPDLDALEASQRYYVPQ